MTQEQLERRLRALEYALRGADYVRNQDEADEAERLESVLPELEEETISAPRKGK